MAKFSDDFRAGAVLMLEATGYPERKGGLTKVAHELNVPLTTLARWFTAKSNPPPISVVTAQRNELVSSLNGAASALIQHLTSIADTGDVLETAMALSIIMDHLRELTGE